MYAQSAETPPRRSPCPPCAKRKRVGEKIVIPSPPTTPVSLRRRTLRWHRCRPGGDSLGMVVQGQSSTLSVTVDHMVYHGAAVARRCVAPRAWWTCPSHELCRPCARHATALRLMGEGGAAMGKLEGAGWVNEVIARLSERDVPVRAHRSDATAVGAQAGRLPRAGRERTPRPSACFRPHGDVEAAGAAMLVLECVPANSPPASRRRSPSPPSASAPGALRRPGSGRMYDLLGITPGEAAALHARLSRRPGFGG